LVSLLPAASPQARLGQTVLDLGENLLPFHWDIFKQKPILVVINL